jgi:regulator of protease activity HflC (stomatin/prohibitin superfamily)
LEQKTSSSVEVIINALSELEKDMDSLNSRVEEMEKRLVAYSNEEIEKLNQQIVALANDEAKKIVDAAKAEAEKESSLIVAEADKNLAKIKESIDSSYDKAVDTIVNMILTIKDSNNLKGNNDKTSKNSREYSKGIRDSHKYDKQISF